jgi:hypothetical protein
MIGGEMPGTYGRVGVRVGVWEREDTELLTQ